MLCRRSVYNSLGCLFEVGSGSAFKLLSAQFIVLVVQQGMILSLLM